MAIVCRFALRVTAELASSPLVDIMREKRGQKQRLCVCIGVCVRGILRKNKRQGEEGHERASQVEREKVRS